MSLAEERVAILGGTSGIGLATARLLALAGARVIVAGRDAAKLERALAELPEQCEGACVDATDRAALDRLAAALGRIDHLVLALAAGGGAGSFRDLDLGALRRVVEGKAWAFLEALQALLPTLRGDGSVTLVTAATARAAFPGTAGIAFNNGALNAIVPPLAVELAPLRVNAVCPGVIETPIFARWPEAERERFFARARAAPLGRPGRPEEVARAILFLIEDPYVTGATLEVDGGMRLTGAPRPAR
ncbi:MAG: SDR family oxidoreductase [Geminicoccaceae bacterium]|nr:SDR family oxidoreductase [Geminicoccaceae bacterium]MDW8371161.1 SDR family oxidoreductase [Geminicoccaceae bacterium]